MKKLHFALIGAGKMGSRWMGVIPKFAILKDIYDPKCFPSNMCSRSLKDILKDKNIDAVLIATPHKYLASLTEQALKAGKHVLCEKPGAITSNQIEENIALAKKKGLIYMIGYNCRFHDGFIKARKLYKKGVIGKLLFIRSRFGFGGRPGYEKEWRINKELGGGGHLHDQGVHMIDMAKSFIGRIKEVTGMISSGYWKTGTEDNGFVLLKGENKVIASTHSSLTQWKRLHNFEIYGTKGYLTIEGLGMRYGEPEKLILGKRTRDSDVVKEKIIKCNAVADNSLRLELKEFMSAIKNKRTPNPSPLEAYETLSIVEYVYRTSKI